MNLVLCPLQSHLTVASWEPGLYAFFVLSGREASPDRQEGTSCSPHYKSAGRSKYVCVSHVKDRKTVCVSLLCVA